MIVFGSAADALEWCLVVQEVMMEVGRQLLLFAAMHAVVMSVMSAPAGVMSVSPLQ
jgi:hypothetical protein